MKKRDHSEAVLIKFFGSTSRARILSLFLDNPGTSFYQREVMYETALSLQAVQRELGNLVELGIVLRREERNRVYYGINTGSPIIGPLREVLESLAKEGRNDRLGDVAAKLHSGSSVIWFVWLRRLGPLRSLDR